MITRLQAKELALAANELDNLRYNENGDDILNGEYITTYDDGQVESKCFYKNGVLDGLAEYYNKNEQLISTMFYKDGKRDQGLFYINGKCTNMCFFNENDKMIIVYP